MKPALLAAILTAATFSAALAHAAATPSPAAATATAPSPQWAYADTTIPKPACPSNGIPVIALTAQSIDIPGQLSNVQVYFFDHGDRWLVTMALYTPQGETHIPQGKGKATYVTSCR